MNSTKFAIKSRNFIAAAVMGAACHSVNAEIFVIPMTPPSPTFRIEERGSFDVPEDFLSERYSPEKNRPQPPEIIFPGHHGLPSSVEPALPQVGRPSSPIPAL